MEIANERHLVQQLHKNDSLKQAYLSAQQATEKCYADGMLVVSQAEHDRRVASLKQAEKVYNQHVKDFVPGVVSITGQAKNIFDLKGKTLVHGIDHTYLLSWGKRCKDWIA